MGIFSTYHTLFFCATSTIVLNPFQIPEGKSKTLPIKPLLSSYLSLFQIPKEKVKTLYQGHPVSPILLFQIPMGRLFQIPNGNVQPINFYAAHMEIQSFKSQWEDFLKFALRFKSQRESPEHNSPDQIDRLTQFQIPKGKFRTFLSSTLKCRFQRSFKPQWEKLFQIPMGKSKPLSPT